MEYALIRAKRKTTVIQIKKDGSVVVRAPMRLAKYKIDRFVDEKREWIETNREMILTQIKNKEEFKFSDGCFPLMAQLFPIEWTKEKPFYRDGIFHLNEGSEEELRKQAESFYKKIAKEEINRRIDFYAPKLKVQPAAIKINSAKGRWGSCSGKNSLNFSWRLILAPERCINYVVVHELCHILHHDHSKAFWEEVEKIFPDWKSCREQLKSTAKEPWFIP